MPDYSIISLTPENFADYGVCGYKDIAKHKELRNKMDWYSKYYAKGLRIKVVCTASGVYQGMLEYIPGEFAHRPVYVDGYMFIHCVFVGFKKEYKGRGFASALLDECIADARKQQMKGVAVVTRKGSFMSDSSFFLRKGFEVTDTAKPDFSLLALRFETGSDIPLFRSDVLSNPGDTFNGITIYRSVQCPYTEKNVTAIMETSKNKLGIRTRLIELKDASMAQQTPSPFGTFCITYKGKVISHHPISNTRFENIMLTLIKE